MIVEDGTGLIDSNSYVTTDEADTYFTDRGNTTWGSLTNKEALLIQATDYIEAVYSESFKGVKLTDEQALSFPRIINYETVTTPLRVKNAVCELALKANDGELLEDSTQSITEKTVDVLTIKYSEYSPQGTRYNFVQSLLSPYFTTFGIAHKAARA